MMSKQFRLVYSLLTAIFLCSGTLSADGQEDSLITAITTHIAEDLPQEADLSALTERLSFFKLHPIDLNSTTPEQLSELVFLSALQISNFFSHIRSSGKLKELLELQSIEEFDLQTIAWLLPFVILKRPSVFSSLRSGKPFGKDNSEIMLRYGQTLEKQKGFNDLPGSRYLGSPEKLLLKYQYHFNQLISFSFAAAKDAGETFFSGNNKTGFDFLSGSLAVSPKGRFKKIIIGDYSLQFGQGLSLWTGLSLGKGPDVAGVAKKDTGLKPYTSTSTFSFFRGTAITFNILTHIDLTTFISLKNLDASLSEQEDGSKSLSTISISGLHRTATEIKNKGTLQQFLYGAALTINHPGFDAGITAYHSSYSPEFITGSQRYKQYGFRGSALSNLAFHYNYTFKNIYFFGESAQSIPGGLASVNGAMASLSPRLSAVLLYRDYARDHISFYSQALGEGSAAVNEKGLYSGLHFSPFKQWDLSVYSDIFHFPRAKYRVDEPSSGYDLMGQLNYIPGKTFRAVLKVSTQQKEQNESTGLPINPIVKVKLSNYRIEVQWKLSPKIGMRNRIEVTAYQKGIAEHTDGYMIYQDVNYSPMSSKLSANIRVAYFHTPTYENRIYAYENDVLNGSGSGLYNGKGIRTFLNLNYRLSKHLRIWGRYAVFIYSGNSTTGTGLDEIRGNRKTDVKVQLRYQF